MATKQEIATQVETDVTALIGGSRVDLLYPNELPDNCSREMRYTPADGGFFLVTKDGSIEDQFCDAQRTYALLTRSCTLKLSDPDYQTYKAVFAAAQLTKIQEKITADKAE